jgi:peptide/nickel transport system ATP-binding protein/oligopeptide transport system ATP-binding protein
MTKLESGIAAPLLSVENIKTYYEIDKGLFRKKRIVKAVDGVSFKIYQGETLALVGESGCGKSTTGRTILGLEKATSGRVMFQQNDITNLSYAAFRPLRRKMQMIFQDPWGSLDPKKTVRQILAEMLQIHTKDSKKERTRKSVEMLELVGLTAYHMDSFPHEFSGGQRQRIAIARAIIVRPELIVADEPVSALDLSIQSQVINLLCELQQKWNLSYLFISHDMNVVRHISNRVGVMYLGQLVEIAPTEEIFATPRHPYTQALLSAIPVSHPDEKKERVILPGEIPNPSAPPSGCLFHPRCPRCMEICAVEPPTTRRFGLEAEVACHLYSNQSPKI